MKKIEDLNERVMLLKKRFRQSDMNEIYEVSTRSIIDTINKIKKNTITSTKTNNFFQFKDKKYIFFNAVLLFLKNK